MSTWRKKGTTFSRDWAGICETVVVWRVLRNLMTAEETVVESFVSRLAVSLGEIERTILWIEAGKRAFEDD